MKNPRFKRTRKSEDTEPNKLNAGNIRHPKRTSAPEADSLVIYLKILLLHHILPKSSKKKKGFCRHPRDRKLIMGFSRTSYQRAQCIAQEVGS
jgi:hypothetical protein